MISFGKWPRVLFASVLAMALWTFISVNTNIFSVDGKFDGFMYFSSYILVIGVWALVAVKINVSDKFYKAISIFIFALTPFFCMQVAMILSGAAEYSFGIYFINIMFYVAIMAIILAITRSMKWTAIVTNLVAYLFNLSSFVVNILRGTPLIPSDFLAIGTAAQVAENYTFQLRYPIVVATVIVVLVITLIAKFSFKPQFKHKNLIFSLSGGAVALAFIITMSCIDFTNSSMDVYDQYHANNTHGSLYSFYINIRKMMLSKPKGYKEEDVQALLSNADSEEQTTVDKEEMPNIIAIMNESFSDLNVVGDLQTSEDYMPFIHSMTKNTIKGQLLVSPFGGYTCNTEFEFLTGLSMGVLPRGSVPYLQYVSKQYPFSLPSHLDELGYKSVAVHPYLGRCWNRQKIYELMGFDEFISFDNIKKYMDEDDIEYVRHYVSDRTSFKLVTDQLENKKPGEKMFLFNVTMQNHGGYTYDGGEFPTVTISNLQGHYKEAEQYLSLIKESDKAFEELVRYLKNYDEPTIVVMFGDHQPAVEQEFYEELYGKSLSKLSTEELQQRYKIPFVIWANYDIESQDDLKTSPNYLSDLLLDTANVPKNEIENFTSEVRNDVPQINAMGHYDSDGNWVSRDEDTSNALDKYEAVEYYMLTRKENKDAKENKDDKK